VRHRGYPRFNSINGWSEIRSRGWERLTVVRICEWFEELGGRLSELAAQLAKATQPGHFNKYPQWRQSRRHDLMAKDD